MRSLRILLLPALAASVAAAQTTAVKRPAATTAHPTAAHTAAKLATACVQVPELSPKVPSLPAGVPCAKALYTITTTPTTRIDNISPLEGSGLAAYLGIEPTTFTLAYIDTKIGEGPLAGPHQYYSIHYTGYLTDGTKFDSSIDRGEPITIPYGGRKVIPGWDTGFAGMHVGGKRRLFIPYQLGYGANGSGPIPPKSELIFDVELVSVSDTPPPAPAPPAAARPATPPASSAAPATAQPTSGNGSGSAPATANPTKP